MINSKYGSANQAKTQTEATVSLSFQVYNRFRDYYNQLSKMSHGSFKSILISRCWLAADFGMIVRWESLIYGCLHWLKSSTESTIAAIFTRKAIYGRPVSSMILMIWVIGIFIWRMMRCNRIVKNMENTNKATKYRLKTLQRIYKIIRKLTFIRIYILRCGTPFEIRLRHFG